MKNTPKIGLVSNFWGAVQIVYASLIALCVQGVAILNITAREIRQHPIQTTIDTQVFVEFV